MARAHVCAPSEQTEALQRRERALQDAKYEAERRHQLERRNQRLLQEDPNAFDANLGYYNKLRQTGTNTAALLTFSGM